MGRSTCQCVSEGSGRYFYASSSKKDCAAQNHTLSIVLKCGGAQKQTTWRSFFKLQKMCVHHISGAGYRSHTDPIFASNKILKIMDLVKYKLLTLAHQAFYASHPLSCPLMNLFCISELPNINLLFKFSQHGSLYGIDYPTVRIPKLWSLEDLELRNIKKLEPFKSALYSKLKRLIVITPSVRITTNIS